MLAKKDTGRNSSFIESIRFTNKAPFSPFNLSRFPPPRPMTPEPSTLPYSTPPIIIVIIIHPVSTRILVQYRYRTLYHPSSRYRTNESEKRKKNANTIFNHRKEETLLYVRRRLFCTNRLKEILRRYEEAIWESWEKWEKGKKKITAIKQMLGSTPKNVFQKM